MANSRPSFLIVPGAWHQPRAYEPLISHLNSAGLPATAISLPSCDTDTPQSTTCSIDTEAVRKQILTMVETEAKEIVVVCCSYGGIPGGGTANGLSRSAHQAEGKQGDVIGLVYISAFVVLEGSSLLEIMDGNHAPYLLPDHPSTGLCTIEGARNVLYNDLDDDKAEHFVHLLRPNSMHALDSSAPPMAWAEPEFVGKLTFLRCMQDQALPPFLQDMFMQRSGVEWIVKNIEASHSAFASKTKEVVDILTECVETYRK